MPNKNYLFTSESVTEGHPDKICDRISDEVLDAVLRQDKTSRVACETFITVGMVIVGGEITTKAKIDVQDIVRRAVKDIGYTDHRFGFDYDTCSVLNAIGTQSPDISQGVDTGGAGDQGLMVGYACCETKSLGVIYLFDSENIIGFVSECSQVAFSYGVTENNQHITLI